MCDLLTAVTELGNEGTHESSELTMLDVLGGAELLDEAFHEFYAAPLVHEKALVLRNVRGQSRSPGPDKTMD